MVDRMAPSPQPKPKRSLLHAFVVFLGWAFLAVLGIIAVVIALFLWGMSTPRPAPLAKSDSTELRQFINIDIPITSVKWEIFRSPDDSFFPAPDVYSILIADIELSDPSWYKPRPVLTTRGDVMPESAREWLSQPFKDLMHRAPRDDNALAAFKCSEFSTSIKSSGRVVDGYICPSPGRVLLYITVDAPP